MISDSSLDILQNLHYRLHILDKHPISITAEIVTAQVFEGSGLRVSHGIGIESLSHRLHHCLMIIRGIQSAMDRQTKYNFDLMNLTCSGSVPQSSPIRVLI